MRNARACKEGEFFDFRYGAQMESVSLSVDHGILFVVDPTNREAIVPEYVEGELVAATDSCLSIAVDPYVDGEVEVSLTTEEVVTTGLHLAATHTLAVPGGVVAIGTAEVDRALEYRLSPGSVVISDWADSFVSASRVVVAIAVTRH